LRRQIGTRTPTVEYICTKPDILFTLCRGWGDVSTPKMLNNWVILDIPMNKYRRNTLSSSMKTRLYHHVK
jgi:hypothetical protein